MALIDCPMCGQTISDRATKCPHCGAEFKSPTSISTSTQIPPKHQQAGKPNTPRNSNKLMRIFLYILLGLIVAGGVGYFFYDRHQSKLETERIARSEYVKKQFVQTLKNRAKAGDSDAQFNYGKCLIQGVGVAQNYDEGVSWIEKSAKQGNSSAKDFLINEGIW